MKVGVGADHGGFEMKEQLAKLLASQGHEVIDFGNKVLDRHDDYPDFAIPLARAVALLTHRQLLRKDRIPIMNQESVGGIARDASRNCCKVQAAVGWDVTLHCTMRRLPTSISTNAYSTRNLAVIATNKSLATMTLA
jgi:hypothetical protein